MAWAAYRGTYVAAMGKVDVDRRTGRVEVRRAVRARDMRLVVNLEGARRKTDGSATMGLGYSVSEDVRFRGGERINGNSGTSGLPWSSWLPRIDTVLVEALSHQPNRPESSL
jgi:CO/xanthine dehydrogenase Mo-binding subunit